MRRVLASEYDVVAVEVILSRFVTGKCDALRHKDYVGKVLRGGWDAVR